MDANANASTNALSAVVSKFCKAIKYRAKVRVCVSLSVCPWVCVHVQMTKMQFQISIAFNVEYTYIHGKNG